MSSETKHRREIGYLCRRGHYVFDGEDDYSACGSKKIATIYVEPLYEDDEMIESETDDAQDKLVQMFQRMSAS